MYLNEFMITDTTVASLKFEGWFDKLLVPRYKKQYAGNFFEFEPPVSISHTGVLKKSGMAFDAIDKCKIVQRVGALILRQRLNGVDPAVIVRCFGDNVKYMPNKPRSDFIIVNRVPRKYEPGMKNIAGYTAKKLSTSKSRFRFLETVSYVVVEGSGEIHTRVQHPDTKEPLDYHYYATMMLTSLEAVLNGVPGLMEQCRLQIRNGRLRSTKPTLLDRWFTAKKLKTK